MSLNPYSAPRSKSERSGEPPSRKRWVAVVLGLVAPPIAMLYVGRPIRAVAYLAATILGVAFAVFLGAKGTVHPLVFMQVISLVVSFVAAADAYRLASAWNRARLPWYSRAPALAAFMAAGWLSILSVRAFVVEPLRIPSGGMEPTLRVGELILASKSSYGWNLPFSSRRIVRFAGPERGDVAVLRYPGDRRLDYVKRVVGLPGDTVAYVDKRLTINGKEQPTIEERSEVFTDAQGNPYSLVRYQESLGHFTHSILVNPDVPSYQPAGVRAFPGRENCQYDDSGLVCRVPAGQYFVLGDNRDSSSDSRYWGFVAESDFVGRAVLIWYSAQDPKRVGTAVE